jgi:hypothetical protein
VYTVVVDVAVDGAEETIVAVLSCVDHGLISAGTMLNSSTLNHGLSSPWWIPIVSPSSTVYTACQISDVRRHKGHGQA